MKTRIFIFLSLVILTSFIIIASKFTVFSQNQVLKTNSISLLSDPFLQLPTSESIKVVWFTEFSGDNHQVIYGDQLEKKVAANTTQLRLTREDSNSKLEKALNRLQARNIWRHEAIVTDLIANKPVPYRVSSSHNGETIASQTFHLTSNPKKGTSLKVLLTSDHQLMPMTAANLEQVVGTIDRIDGVFLAGDLVNIPDRASEWFDDNRGGAFFPCLQGRGSYELEKDGVKTVYRGGEIIQNAPLFTAVGNHEVMGRFSEDAPLKEQFKDAIPLTAAKQLYQQQKATINPNNDPEIESAWLKANSFNTDTYEEIFSLPNGKHYYVVTFGDIRLVVLYVTNIWRMPQFESDVQGRYQEKNTDLDNSAAWGYGQHIFESIAPDSPQYSWLQQELAGEEFQQAKYKIVMFHHPPHTLGGNIVPPYTNPQPIEKYDSDGKLISRRYQYPIAEDYIIRDLIPLLESAGVQLVYYGHSHLWNRFVSPSGMHFLESSNVGNSYGAHLADNPRQIPPKDFPGDYVAVGNPNGLEAIIPNIAPLQDDSGNPLPYIASNDITAFSIFDTETGTVTSYRYDTRQPDKPAIPFDRFELKRE